MKKIIFVISILVFGNLCAASEVQLGVMLGANYSSYKWDASSDKFSTTGYGAGGGILLSFFQNKRMGFRVVGLDNYINSKGVSDSGQTAKITGTAPSGAVTLTFNFDQASIRNSVGIGYGYESFSGLKCAGTGSTTFPTSSSGGGLVVDFKVALKPGTYGYAQGFLPVDNLTAFSSIIRGFVGMGYDFGDSK
jgi:hypothetical protein